jgi:hypothetical protein
VDALHHFEAVHAPEGVIESIEWIAVASVEMNQPLPAIRLFAAAEAARHTLRMPPMPQDAQVVAAHRDVAMRSAEGDAAADALASGREMSLEEAHRAALALTVEQREAPGVER